ncbi:intermembrane transport protein PqiB [Pseudoalteromonas sp. PS5]|uniref:intermembrane transport protein PqiB n=1 Tax=Pseudoalteromonas sp. PS5 TaxID=1437473 RepID=UPI000FFF0923|nr:intermembrane transport protein PqiB [Pseudoalteromonas sp. PS5]RXF04250.1 MCE family protein [Pseudoalteromonas sp. PS5]
MTTQADIEDKPKFSVIWIIPIIALLITGWMLYQHQINKGHTIFIKMNDADGIIAGKTEVRVKSVKVGLVESLKLELNQNAVVAKVRVLQPYSDLLAEDSSFWVVKPRIDESGISGMNTLLSGVYIELSPGEAKVRSSIFTLMDEPALISAEVEGKRYKLVASDAEVLDVGSSIFFRNFKIGQVESAHFSVESLKMEYGIFIYSPYNKLITDNAIFWISSGIDFKLSTEGVEVSTGSLAKMIKGGISVDYPPSMPSGKVSTENKSYALHKNFSMALERRFDHFDYYLVEFEQSIRGLKAGAPVEYRGMRIGTIEQVPATGVSDDRPLYFQRDNTSVPVLVKIEYGRIYEDAKLAQEYWSTNIEKWIRNGLRASLKSGNLLTGAVYIELDFYPSAEIVSTDKATVYPVLPSVSSGITALSEQVTSLLNKLNGLPLETTVKELEGALQQHRLLAMEMNQLVKSVNENDITEKVGGNLTSLKDTLNQLTSSLKQFEQTMTQYQKGSGVMEQLSSTLEEIESLSNRLKPISKGLNEQPNMLIFNKEAEADPQPRKTK